MSLFVGAQVKDEDSGVAPGGLTLVGVRLGVAPAGRDAGGKGIRRVTH